MQCGARVLPVNPQLPQTLLEALVPKLTLRFALTLEGENAFSGLTALQIQRVQRRMLWHGNRSVWFP